ncbi:MAG: GerMN domain-containing protein [Clostridia bacterium]|nr:GerMN domain-containing protein [Clostridia bacterium]MBR3199468.1 GerMN domain-containing protein [Bacilli bacterium]
MDKKKKKIIIIVVSIVVTILIGIIIYFNISIDANNDGIIDEEIVPEEEISDEQFRETIINLFFVNENNEIVEDIRKIDSKILINNPYNEVLNLLIAGPKSDNLKSYIPNGTRVNNIKKDGECLIIDFSKEFIENADENVEKQGLIIGQIVNTMTQFTEINCVKILIDGEENKSFKNSNIKFEQLFIDED